MTDRYALPPMRDLWTTRALHERWLAVELAALEALEQEGLTPPGVVATVRARVHVDPTRTAAVEAEIGHDLVAFLWTLEEQAGPEGRWLHYGLTSSDVKDTALGLLLRDASSLLIERLRELEEALLESARRHRETPILGRTHGQWAEPTTFGLKLLAWHDLAARARARLEHAQRAVAVGKLAGAVGTRVYFPPQAEARALVRLELAPCVPAGQVVPRDRHADAVFALAGVGTCVETIALEVRHLCRSELCELCEGRPEGSSAMPHKRNPILSERLCGLARLLRSNVGPALEDVALWHERDMSHSSVERVMLPQAFTLADYMAARAVDLVRGLHVDGEAMEAHVAAAGSTVLSEGLLHVLIAAGWSRRLAHEHVAALVASARNEGRPLLDLALDDVKIAASASRERLAEVLDVHCFLEHAIAAFDHLCPGDPG